MGSVGIQKYLDDLGLSISEVGDNWNIDCIFCDDDRKRLGFKKSTGQFNCFNCEEKGSFKKFQRAVKDERQLEVKFEQVKVEKKLANIDQTLSEKYHKRLKAKGRNAISYLMDQRGFSRETINHFQLGSWKTKGHEYVSIPFFEFGKTMNFKFRALEFTNKKYKWRRIKDGKSSLFHDDVCDQKQFDEVYICEAEFDCVALFNLGIKNVISVTTGAKKFQPHWYDRLERFKRIYLVYDNDVDGQDGAEKIADRLGFGRCFNIKLPDQFKDVNEYLWNATKKEKRHTLKDFRALVKASKKFAVRDSVSLRDALKQIQTDRYVNDEEEMYGLPTPWNCMNKLLQGGAKPGQLIVVSSPPKRGKTRFVMNWQRFLANERGIAAGLYCCEMTPKELAKVNISMSCRDFTSQEDITDIQIAETALIHNKAENIFFGYPNEDELTLDSVCDWAKRMKHRHGMKWFCFDNLHFLVRGDNVKDRIGEVTRRLKLLAGTENIVVVLIVHPRKVGDKMMTADDLKDSSSTYQDLDTLIILHRDRKDARTGDDDNDDNDGNLDEMVQVHVEGRGVRGGKARLYYQGERGLFFETGTMYEKAMDKWKRKIAQRKKSRRKR